MAFVNRNLGWRSWSLNHVVRIVISNSKETQGLIVGSGVLEHEKKACKLRAMYNVGDMILF
jgi:hypothetical protein